MLRIKNISKSYKGKTAIMDITLDIESGKIYGLIGNNGAGKTTLLNCIANQVHPEIGSIDFQGHKLSYADLAHIAYFMDHSIFDENEKVIDIINDYAYFFDDFDRQRMEDLLPELEIHDSYRLKEMSLGTRKKCELALVLSRNAQLYLLDEPFANLDPLIRLEMMKLIVRYTREDASYIISTHQVQEVESYLDATILLKNGKLILMGDNDSLRESYACSISELLINELLKKDR